MIKGIGLLSIIVILAFSSSRMSAVTVNHVRDGGCPHDSLEYDSLSGLYVHQYSDVYPMPVGGMKALRKSMKIKYVPKPNQSVPTSAWVYFVIDKNGNYLAPRIRGKQISEYNDFEKAVVKAIPDTLSWVAGKCNGEAVNVLRFVPINACYRIRR